MRSQKLASIVLIVFTIITISSIVSADISEYRLIFTDVHRINPQASQLMAFNLEGQVTAFSDQEIGPDPIYLSPDGKIAVRDTKGTLIVLDTNGTSIFKYEFSPLPEAQSLWQVWGWQDTSTLIVSVDRDHRWLFYRIDIDSGRVEEAAWLNEFLAWDFATINDSVEVTPIDGTQGLIVFSPSFEYAMTPYLENAYIDSTEGGEIQYFCGICATVSHL